MPYFTFTIEDYSPFITYSSGDWSPGTSSDDSSVNQYSQSTFMKTNKAGATAKIAFNGTGITVYGAKRANHGLFITNLDGNANSPVNGSANPAQFQQSLYDAHNLDQGLHTLQITNQNEGSYLDIDFITIEGNVGENSNGNLYVVNYQDSDNSFSYQPSTSQWSTNPTNLGTFFGASGHSIGDGVSLYGPLSQSGSPYTVSLDGAAAITLTSLTDRYLPQALLYHATNVGGGQHHLKVSYTPNGNNQVFAVDYANVYTTNSNSTSSGSSSSGSNGGSGSTNGSAASSSGSGSGSSLSAGAAAGITLAACVIVALVAVLIFLLMRRRKQQQVDEKKPTNPTIQPYMNDGRSPQTNLATPTTYSSNHLPNTFGSGAAAAGIPAAAMNGGYAGGSTSDLNSPRHRNVASESNTSSSNPTRYASNPGGASSDGGISDLYGDLPSPVATRKTRLHAQRPNEPSPPDYMQATYGH